MNATATAAGAEAPQFVSTARLAEVLDCHPRTLGRLADRGLIPSPVDIGGLRRWNLQAVLAALLNR